MTLTESILDDVGRPAKIKWPYASKNMVLIGKTMNEVRKLWEEIKYPELKKALQAMVDAYDHAAKERTK